MPHRHYSRHNTEKEHHAGRVLARVIVIVVLLVCISVLAVLAGDSILVTDGAMSPSLGIGDTVVVSRISYLVFRPARGDVVMFSTADSSAGRSDATGYIRRVIGLPGETVRIADGIIYINGNPLSASYTAGEVSYAGIAASQLTLENDEYFLMADNSSNNFDSRDSTLGPVHGFSITGKVWLKLFPLKEFGLVR